MARRQHEAAGSPAGSPAASAEPSEADLLPFPIGNRTRPRGAAAASLTGMDRDGEPPGTGARSNHPANTGSRRTGDTNTGEPATRDGGPARSDAARAIRSGRVAAARKHVNDGRPEARRRRTPTRLHPEEIGRIPENSYPVTNVGPAIDEPDDAGPRRDDVDVWGRSERFRELVRKLGSFHYHRWFRVEWEGLEKIPTSGGALLIANHAAAIPSDAPMIMQGIEEELHRPVYGLADFWFRTLPLAGTLWSRGGGVPAHPDNAQRLLHDDGQLALVFPEGIKGPSKLSRDRYQLRRFGRGGFVETAMRAGVPIVPIAIVGAEESMPVLFKVPAAAKVLGLPYLPVTANHLLLGPLLGTVTWLPAKFRFRVLDPIRFDVPEGLERYPRSRVMEEADEIRQRLQEALYEMLEQRRSVWFG